MSHSDRPSPREVALECYCLHLRRAARTVSRRYDDALRGLDLNNGQFSMLTVVAGLQPVPMQALADRLAMDRTTVTAGLKPLERRGLLRIDSAEADARSREVSLTAKGQGLLAKALPVWRRLQAQVGRDLGPLPAQQLRGHLAALV